MNIAEEYFMVVVQEKGIARAAEKLFLSQQNLSNSMKRLEQQYGPLFWRKPHFRLTPQGEELYKTLQQIRVLEASLDTRLQEMQNHDMSTIRFGIPATRGRLLLPKLLKRFRGQFPSTRVELFLEDTEKIEKMLLCGDLDLILGLDVTPQPELTCTFSVREKIYFVASSRLLQRHRMERIDWNRLAELPILLNPPVSHFRQEIDRYFKRLFVVPNRSTVVGDFELQLILAAQEEGACFCTQMMLEKMEEINKNLPQEEKLQAFLVQDEKLVSNLSIVRHRHGVKSRAMDTFAEILADLIREQ